MSTYPKDYRILTLLILGCIILFADLYVLFPQSPVQKQTAVFSRISTIRQGGEKGKKGNLFENRQNILKALDGKFGFGKISVNHADANELIAVVGIGPSLARKIVHYREVNGYFSCPEDLLKVPGIGTARARQFASQLSFGKK